MKVITSCAICSCTELSPLWDLPKLPLSETYGDYDCSFDSYDQVLMLCRKCGHVQLKNQLSPKLLYGRGYKYETSKSVSTKARLDSFITFMQANTAKPSRCVIDIGGNDTSLLDRIDADKKYLIDPSLKQRQTTDIECIKAYIEDVNFNDFDADTIVCTHVLEHIADPGLFIRSILFEASHTQIFFFEVPCFEKQIAAGRLDAVFHQHYHYFYPSTVRQLISLCGGEVIDMAYNTYPTCGGSLMFAFKKAASQKFIEAESSLINSLCNKFDRSLSAFRDYNNAASDFIVGREYVFGFGASLLLPVIFYHIGGASKKIHCILDDDVNKDGVGYKNLENLIITHSGKAKLNDGDGILVTSYENFDRIKQAITPRYGKRVFASTL